MEGDAAAIRTGTDDDHICCFHASCLLAPLTSSGISPRVWVDPRTSSFLTGKDKSLQWHHLLDAGGNPRKIYPTFPHNVTRVISATTTR